MNVRLHLKNSRMLALTAIVTLVASAFAASALNSNAARSTQKKQFVIGSVVNDLSNAWLATLAKAEKAKAAKLGMKITVVNGALNTSTQVAAVQQFITQKVDAILLTPSDPNGIGPAIKQANAANIPVFTVNTTAGKNDKIVNYTGANDYQYGLQLGALTAKAIGGKGNVAVLLGVVGTSPQVLRTKGIQDAFKKFPNIKIVSKTVDEWNNGKNLAAVQDVLSKYPNGQLQAIVAQGPQLMTGAHWAKTQGRTDVKFIAGDYPIQMIRSIKSGEIYGTVLQDPPTQGNKAVLNIYNWLSGRKQLVKRPNDYVQLPLITKANVANYPSAWRW